MMVVYREFTNVVRVDGAGPMTPEAVLDAAHAIGLLGLTAAHVRAHPHDVNDWKWHVYVDKRARVECGPSGADRWAGLTIHPESRRMPGAWVVETEVIRSQEELRP